MKSKNKGRKWILSLGFSDAQADSFIKNDVPNRKIEALAEVQNSGKMIGPSETEPFVAAPGEALPETAAPTPPEEPSEGEGEPSAVEPPKPKEKLVPTGFGDYLCPECKVTHRDGSKIHKRHLKLFQAAQ